LWADEEEPLQTSNEAFARRNGYRVDELIRIIEDMG
jgi:hypothetical protein